MDAPSTLACVPRERQVPLSHPPAFYGKSLGHPFGNLPDKPKAYRAGSKTPPRGRCKGKRLVVRNQYVDAEVVGP